MTKSSRRDRFRQQQKHQSMVSSSEHRRDDSPATSSHTLLIEPREPVLVRDARPFSSDPGAHAFTLPWPFPRTIAKTMRTIVGQATFGLGTWNGPAADDDRAAIARMAVHGPLMVAKHADSDTWQFYVPAPRDVVFHRNPAPDGDPTIIHPMVLRPGRPGIGEGVSPIPDPPDAAACGYINARKRTVANPVLSVTDEVKPEKEVPDWWTLDDARSWLAYLGDRPRSALPILEEGDAKRTAQEYVRGLRAPLRDTRTHVSIEAENQTNVEGALFTTEALAFPGGYVKESLTANARTAAPDHLAMVIRITGAPAGWQPEPGYVPIGGERRLSMLTGMGDDSLWPVCPDPPKGWEAATGLRLLLVTPAIFTYGWLPEWIGNGTIPGLKESKLHLKLVGAAIDRRIPVSGWNTVARNVMRRTTDTNGQTTLERKLLPSGPAATEYAVPAGGIYFFRVTGGRLTHEIWEKLWLAPVSDAGSNRNQGFGLVLPGIWDASGFVDLDDPLSAQEEPTA